MRDQRFFFEYMNIKTEVVTIHLKIFRLTRLGIKLESNFLAGEVLSNQSID